MKLILRGWLRHVLNHTLLDQDISKVRPSETDDVVGLPVEIVAPETAASGDLRIVAMAKKLRLDGDFEITVRLTKDEIANLARIAFANR